MTPAQTKGIIAGVQRDRRKWSLHNAWHAEVNQRTKKLKPFEEVLGEERYEARPQQSAKDMMASLKKMAKEQRKRHERRAPKPEPVTENADG